MVGLSPDDEMALGWAFSTPSPRGRVLRERVHNGESVTAGDVAAIREEWVAAGQPAFRPHVHRDLVGLSDGTSCIAVSFSGDAPYARDVPPDFGLYLDARWDPPWPHDHVDWPDFGVPDRRVLAEALDPLLARARAGERVEIGCYGGHGRTGTALACLAVLEGVPASEAVEWVRSNYCPAAVETPEQCAFVEDFSHDTPPRRDLAEAHRGDDQLRLAD
jgi:hypothetical protein